MSHKVIVNVTTVNIKAHTHQVTEVSDGWEVLSGKSGETYFVAALLNGGFACSCPWGIHRQADDIRSACSHAQAVAELVASQTHKTVALPESAATRVKAAHRKVVTLGDGVILKARKRQMA